MTNDLYKDADTRLDTVVGDRKAYWRMLGRIVAEAGGPDNPEPMHIQQWCESRYGFRLIYDEDGGITGEPEILDSQKYTLCLLKHSG